MENLVAHKTASYLENIQVKSVQQLNGDISSRTYFLVKTSDKEYIACLTQKESISQNEEFIYWQEKYSESKVKVPEIFHYEKGFILQEYLGSHTFLKQLSHFSETECLGFYKKAIDILIKIHEIKKDSNKNYNELNLERFSREVKYTHNSFLENYLKVENNKIMDIEAEFDELLLQLNFDVQVISHRDYHSRNIIISNTGELGIIDFQDTMLGQPLYDLVSLLNDCYAFLNSEQKIGLLGYYLAHSNNLSSLNEKEILKQFEIYSIQRMYKAVGNFAAAYINNKNSYYLKYISFAMEKIRSITMKNKEFKNLQKSLFSAYYDS